MAYVFEKHTVEQFEIEWIKRNFMKYQAFSRVRKDKPNCGICDKPFNQEDNTNLAFVKGKLNLLLCDVCAEKALEGGAVETTFQNQ